MLAELFDYSVIGIVLLVVLFFISVFSIPTIPLTVFYPNLVELLLFFIFILVSLAIALIPFDIYKYLLKDAKDP